jgi:hypothetical protein
LPLSEGGFFDDVNVVDDKDRRRDKEVHSRWGLEFLRGSFKQNLPLLCRAVRTDEIVILIYEMRKIIPKFTSFNDDLSSVVEKRNSLSSKGCDKQHNIK